MTKNPPEAPHGYAEDGITPLAPYGLKADGTPRLNNRGRRAKAAPTGPAATKGSGASAKKARDQRDGLLQLADALLSPAMAGASTHAFVKKVGAKRASGIAGSLVILDGYMPAYAEWVVGLAQTKPGMLAWMDRLEENTPYLQGALITAQMVKALAGNMINPDPRLAEAARMKVAIRNAQMASAIEEEAARMGIRLEPEDGPREHPQEAYEPQPAPMGAAA